MYNSLFIDCFRYNNKFTSKIFLSFFQLPSDAHWDHILPYIPIYRINLWNVRKCVVSERHRGQHVPTHNGKKRVWTHLRLVWTVSERSRQSHWANTVGDRCNGPWVTGHRCWTVFTFINSRAGGGGLILKGFQRGWTWAQSEKWESILSRLLPVCDSFFRGRYLEKCVSTVWLSTLFNYLLQKKVIRV